ncbi:MAG: DUF523 domain-containing protein [Eubacterium sp.]
MKTKILVSACLLGECCKYSGGNNKNDAVIGLSEYFELIPVCPECFGGLPVPREPSEIKNGRVYSKSGDDVTDNFISGAEQTLYIAKECNCPAAVLKERSPSCGFGEIYDGSFKGIICNGNGITADLLYKNDIQIFGEGNVKKLIDLYYFD